MSDSQHSAPMPPPVPRGRRRRKPKRERVRFFSRFRNALLGWEVLRAGRRTGTLAVARTALGGLLLAAIWALYAASFSGNQTFTDTGTEIGKKLNKFAESFALTFFLVQATAVLLLTPVFVAGAIFEERETRSGEILLTTELTRREVYVGKLGARMVQVLLVVLAGMPILFLTQLWGGVAMEMILVDYAATGLAVIGAGVVTAAISAYAESLRGAILRSYGMLFLLDVLLFPASPYFVIWMASLHWGAGLGFLIVYVPLQFLIVIIGYFIGQRWLRMAMLRQKTRVDVRRRGVPPPLPGQDGRRLPPLDDNVDPLLWKELNVGTRVTLRQGFSAFITLPISPGIDDRLEEIGFARWFVSSREASAFFLRFVCFCFALLFLLLVFLDLISSEWVTRVAGALALSWLICAVGLTASTGISRERHKQTLIDLLMLPGPRRDLLRAKALGALARGIWPAIAIGGLILVGVVNLKVSLVSAVCLMLTAAGVTIFTVGFGIWLSARCRNALQATSTWIGVMAAIVIGSFLFAEANVDGIRMPNQQLRDEYPGWSRVVNPLLAWGRLTFRYDFKESEYVSKWNSDFWPLDIGDVYPALLCSLLYAVLGGFFWRAAVRRFEKEGRS